MSSAHLAQTEGFSKLGSAISLRLCHSCNENMASDWSINRRTQYETKPHEIHWHWVVVNMQITL